MQNLLPTGFAWRKDIESSTTKLLRAMAVEFCRIEERARDLKRELDPSRTNELIDEWEKLTGLPDECTVGGVTLNERRQQVVQKLTSRGGQSAAFFINVGKQLGFDLTVQDFREFRAGIGRAGDAINGDLWTFFFQINSEATLVQFFRAGLSAAGEPLAVFGNETLECTIKKLKPAHTDVIFAFGGL